MRTHSRLFIDGAWVEATGGGYTNIYDPTSGELDGRLTHAGKADLDAAVAASQAAFKVWRARSAFERCKIMRSAASLLRERAPQIAALMTREQGKPLKEAGIEIELSADLLDWFAEEGRRVYGRVIQARGPGINQVASREPVGPVAAFTPWNFPISQAIRKIGPALAAGCSMVIKPPEETPATTGALADIFQDAGLPAGTLNFVYGVPSEISEYLISNPVIRKVSFTGSVSVGKHIAALAGIHMKRCTMELGGHAPAIVFDDADIDAAVRLLKFSKYRNSGQVCVSPTRFMIQGGVYEEFKRKFIEEAARVRVGSGDHPDTMMGPLFNTRRLRAVQELITDAVERGAKLELGGSRIGESGHFLEPTVLSQVTPTMRIMNEEPFGPVALLSSFESIDEVIEEGNRLSYGLASYAFTRSAVTASRLSTELEVGMLSINHLGLGLPETPFGGVKDSGYGSEGGTEAIESYLATKFVSHAIL
ncbi:NAD-dependent succinate-semialdehyde dehydrogenase [Paraburkholderia bengalensis]|uniref:NAD-dependent succinate-semialdehyde dehydrogenase n=1 Tax=Paraburkholderia bengalensis TaxID=2747562 RepID=A0ABU8IQI8_9BURK